MLVQIAALEAALGRSLAESERTSATSLLSEAEGLILGYLGGQCGWPLGEDGKPTLPEVVSGVIVRAAIRAMTASTAVPFGVDSQAAGPMNVKYASAVTEGGPWLTKTDKIALRPYRCGGGLSAVTTVTERGSGRLDDGWWW